MKKFFKAVGIGAAICTGIGVVAAVTKKIIDKNNSNDCNGLLTNDFSIECAVDDDSLSNLFGFFIVKEVAATCLEFLFNLVVNLLFNDNRLLGSTNHTVIKCL